MPRAGFSGSCWNSKEKYPAEWKVQVGGGVLESCEPGPPSMDSPWLLLKASFLLLRTQRLCQELEVYRPAASGHASPVAHTCRVETQERPREGSCHTIWLLDRSQGWHLIYRSPQVPLSGLIWWAIWKEYSRGSSAQWVATRKGFLLFGKGEQPLSVQFALQSGYCFQTKAMALTVKPRTC